MSPRRNWNSPNPSLASECSPPPRNEGGGAHSPEGEGSGDSPSRRLEKKLSTLPTLWRHPYYCYIFGGQVCLISCVWKVTKLVFSRAERVAIKIIDKSLLDSKTSKMLLREITVMAASNHPCLVKWVFQIITNQIKIFIVLFIAIQAIDWIDTHQVTFKLQLYLQ